MLYIVLKDGFWRGILRVLLVKYPDFRVMFHVERWFFRLVLDARFMEWAV